MQEEKEAVWGGSGTVGGVCQAGAHVGMCVCMRVHCAAAKERPGGARGRRAPKNTTHPRHANCMNVVRVCVCGCASE